MTKHVFGKLLSHAAIVGVFLTVFSTAQVHGTLISTGNGTTMLNVDDNGILLGAVNVSVGSTLFDVVFTDGSFNDVFNSGLALDANTEAQATNFSQALIDSVLVSANDGSNIFSYSADVIFGCDSILGCLIYTPYAAAAGFFDSVAVFSSPFSGESVFTQPGQLVDFDYSGNGGELGVFADWSISDVNDVPSPSTAILLLLSGLGLVFRRKMSNNQ